MSKLAERLKDLQQVTSPVVSSKRDDDMPFWQVIGFVILGMSIGLILLKFWVGPLVLYLNS